VTHPRPGAQRRRRSPVRRASKTIKTLGFGSNQSKSAHGLNAARQQTEYSTAHAAVSAAAPVGSKRWVGSCRGDQAVAG